MGEDEEDRLQDVIDVVQLLLRQNQMPVSHLSRKQPHMPSVTHVAIDPSQHCNPTKIQGLEMLSQEQVPWLLWTVSVVALLKMLLIQMNCTKGEIPPNAHSLKGSVCK